MEDMKINFERLPKDINLVTKTIKNNMLNLLFKDQ